MRSWLGIGGLLVGEAAHGSAPVPIRVNGRCGWPAVSRVRIAFSDVLIPFSFHMVRSLFPVTPWSWGWKHTNASRWTAALHWCPFGKGAAGLFWLPYQMSSFVFMEAGVGRSQPHWCCHGSASVGSLQGRPLMEAPRFRSAPMGAMDGWRHHGLVHTWPWRVILIREFTSTGHHPTTSLHPSGARADLLLGRPSCQNFHCMTPQPTFTTQSVAAGAEWLSQLQGWCFVTTTQLKYIS